ncbi:hypothetical protein XF14_20975 [Burkholderia gladioli]|nr:hypothetical protein XF14_20975 [Burkholderia gladioli]
MPPAPDSASGHLKPAWPSEADSEICGNNWAVAAPTAAAEAFSAASAARMSGRVSSRREGTTTGTSSGNCSSASARSSGAWSGVRPISTASACRALSHCWRRAGSEASSEAALCSAP